MFNVVVAGVRVPPRTVIHDSFIGAYICNSNERTPIRWSGAQHNKMLSTVVHINTVAWKGSNARQFFSTLTRTKSRTLDLDEVLYLAAEAGIGTRQEMQKRIMTSPSFSPDKSPFILENIFASTGKSCKRKKLNLRSQGRSSTRLETIKELQRSKVVKKKAKLDNETSNVYHKNPKLTIRQQQNTIVNTDRSSELIIEPVQLENTQKGVSEVGEDTDRISEKVAATFNPQSLKAFTYKNQQWLQEAEGRGTCKRAVAHVVLRRGTGLIHIKNHKDFHRLFPHYYSRFAILQPFVLTETCGVFDVFGHCRGGGFSGKARALRLAIGRALVAANPATGKILQDELVLYEDTRKRWPHVPRRYGARASRKFKKR